MLTEEGPQREISILCTLVSYHLGRPDPSLLDNVLIPEDFFEFIYHIGSCFNMHSIIASGLVAGGRIHGRDLQTVFFTAFDPMGENWVDLEKELDMPQPRYTKYKHVWKVAQDAQCWVDINRAQKTRLKLYQTTSKAITHHDTLPPVCIERVVSGRNHETLHT